MFQVCFALKIKLTDLAISLSFNMCFYDQYVLACNCHRWGNFRQHCAKEYRTGETCGMRLIMSTIMKREKCKTCEKLDIKYRRKRDEEHRIKRWMKEGAHH